MRITSHASLVKRAAINATSQTATAPNASTLSPQQRTTTFNPLRASASPAVLPNTLKLRLSLVSCATLRLGMETGTLRRIQSLKSAALLVTETVPSASALNPRNATLVRQDSFCSHHRPPATAHVLSVTVRTQALRLVTPFNTVIPHAEVARPKPTKAHALPAASHCSQTFKQSAEKVTASPTSPAPPTPTFTS